MQKFRLFLAALILLAVAAAPAYAFFAPHPDHVASFTEAVERGYIDGDPAYYYNGEASPLEYAHAVMTALIYFEDNVIGGLPSTTTTTTMPVPATTSTTTTTTPIPVTTTTSTTTTTAPPTTTSTTTLPSGSVVSIPPGIHAGWSMEATDNTAYVCEAGAILDGGGSKEHAFYGDADNVTIRGCEIRNYVNEAQTGAVDGRGADNWTIADNEIHHNWGVGVFIDGDQAMLLDNNIHHQHQLGVAIDHSEGSVVDGNEIAFNNWLQDYSWGWEAGGTKFWDTDGLVVRGNWSHDNFGPGLWDDYNNINVLYEDNLVERNAGNGIFHEIGYAAIIRNNTLIGNGFDHDAWLWGSGVLIAASQDTEVYGNYVEGNYNGVTLVDQGRWADSDSDYPMTYGRWETVNNSVHDNVIVGSGITGGATDVGFDEMFDPGVNVFYGNTYVDGEWEWGGPALSWSGWLAFHPGDA